MSDRVSTRRCEKVSTRTSGRVSTGTCLVGEVVLGFEYSCLVFAPAEPAVVALGGAVGDHGDLTGHMQAGVWQVTATMKERDERVVVIA